MARTTLALDDDLLERMKAIATSRKTTVQAVANELIRSGLTRKAREKFRLKMTLWDATPQPGVDISDRDRLIDIMEGS